MVDENSTFGGFLTDIGEAKQANANALKIPWKLTHMLLGDANGTDPVPAPEQAGLINQVYRAAINQLFVDPANPAILIAELVLPPNVGGWWIRELGLEDEDGDFVAVANCAPSYKPLLAQGSGRNQVVRMHLIVSNTANVELKVDPSVVLATRSYIDDSVAEHEQSRNHPAATTTALGFVEKATPTEAKNGTPDKFPDSAALKATLLHHSVGGAIDLPGGTDLNTVTRPGLYLYVGGVALVNGPISGAGYIEVINRESADLPMQRFSRTYENRLWLRARTGTLSTSGWTPWVEILHSGNQQAATTTLAGVVEKATTDEAKAGAADKFPDAAGVKAAIAASRSGDQFSTYDAARTYTTGEITRGSDGRFYEFYDRDQAGTVKGVDPTNVANRPHVWMEWHGVRPGTVIEWRSTTLPEGYVENDGAAIGRSAYRRIYAAFGTTHGVGNGATTFNLPDDRGEFKRGLDRGRGVDAGREMGSHQVDALQNITGSIARVVANPLGLNPTGVFTAVQDGGTTDTAAGSGEATWNISFNASRVARTAAETRSRNNAVIYLTKI
ncbi:Phage-related tail fibre protein [Modicisalibacter muralis]|uniref:Phage-related tail fibre protein n=1 Tax=Modicisalibacter muralis TaxID=119000 RepID=A0A1G9EQI8_9GAMM|nr:phage tail protein [Halomonas muralis]SDK78399.1 Phage-related tail fibre protein [Halomonas muralis]